MDWVGRLANLSHVWLILAGWSLSCICGQLMASWSKRPCMRQFSALFHVSPTLFLSAMFSWWCQGSKWKGGNAQVLLKLLPAPDLLTFHWPSQVTCSSLDLM